MFQPWGQMAQCSYHPMQLSSKSRCLCGDHRWEPAQPRWAPRSAQNHRMVGVSRSIWVHLLQPLLQQGHPAQGAQAFGDLQERDSTASMGNLCQFSIICTAQMCLLVFRGNLLYSHVCSLLLVLALDTTDKSQSLSYLHTPFRYLWTLMRSPLASSSPS